MPEKFGQSPDKKGEEGKYEGIPQSSESEAHKPVPDISERQTESPQTRKEEIDKVRALISKEEVSIPEPKQVINISEYISKHYPTESSSVSSSVTYALFRGISKLIYLRTKVEGTEKLPSKPHLIVSTHEGGETGKLIGKLPERIHMMAAGIVNFSSPTRRWILTKLRMIPLAESLGNLNEAEREQAVVMASKKGEGKTYKKVKERTESASLQGSSEDIRRAVACLIAGESVAIFPQGLFSYGEKNRKGRGGYAAIAREYEKITGKQLDIVPVKVDKNKITIRNSFHLPQYDKNSKKSRSEFYGDFVMERINQE